MRLYSFIFVTALLCSDPSRLNGQAQGVGSTVVADALSWYSMWMTNDPSAETAQTCRGELRGNSYQFRCDPLAVVMSVIFDDSEQCVVTNMRQAVFDQDGLRVRSIPGFNRRKLSTKSECGELPNEEGPFEITVKLRSREVSDKLTAAAQDAAVEYIRRGEGHCLLRFPKVRTGDPFFHIYEECEGMLETVWEFTIRRGRVARFAHWYYPRKRLPEGAEGRQHQADLWSEVLRPQ